jgi:hypothetical protein
MDPMVFTMDAKERKDGRLYITSKDLSGFRLIVHPGENLEEEVVGALKVFYPLHMASKAKAEAQKRVPRVERTSKRLGEFSLSAEFEMA